MLGASGLVKAVGEGRAARTLLDGAAVSTSRPGELVAVLGRSGSGKSTLLHVLGGLDRADGRADRGRRASASTAPRSARLAALRASPDRLRVPVLPPAARAQRRGQRAAGRTGARRASAAPDARAGELIERLGLDAVAGLGPAQLSGGEQQRFAIARALVNDPAVVLADEPTGNLDDASGAEVLRLLRETADEGRAVLLVTHDHAATRRADRVLHLRDGLLAREALAGGRGRRSPRRSSRAPR